MGDPVCVQTGLAVDSKEGQTSLVSPLVVGVLPLGNPVFKQAGLAVGPEEGPACPVSLLVELGLRFGEPVLVQAWFAVGAEAGYACPVSTFVVGGLPAGIAVLVQAGLAVNTEVRHFDKISVRIVFLPAYCIAVLTKDRHSSPADPCRPNAISLGIVFALLAGDSQLGRTGLAVDIKVTYGADFARRSVANLLDINPIGVGSRVTVLVQISSPNYASQVVILQLTGCDFRAHARIGHRHPAAQPACVGRQKLGLHLQPSLTAALEFDDRQVRGINRLPQFLSAGCEFDRVFQRPIIAVMEGSIGRAIDVSRVRGPAAAVDVANAVGAVSGRIEFPREMAAPDLCGAQFADALGNAPAFDVIGIVADLRAVVVPIGETANGGRQKQRGSRQPSH